MLVSFFRNPIFARVVGIVAALAFLLPLIRYKHGLKIAVPLVMMIVIFLLGFFIDFVEIAYIFIPMIAPILLKLGIDPLWFGILVALNLQASFLTPPFGFSLFYLRGVAPSVVSTPEIYRGVIPFIFLQLVALEIVMMFPGIVRVF